MLRKQLCIVIAVVFCIFACGFTSIGMDQVLNNQEIDRVTAITTAYLQAATYASYFYEECDFERMTIESIPIEDNAVLAQQISDYSEFRLSLKAVPYNDTKLTSASVETMRDNLSLHRKNVDYHAHINELERTTYSYFTPTYDVVDCTISGNLASVNLYERLDFQYSNCEEPSMVLLHYLVSLVKYQDEWLVMAVESDDPFYEAYRETGIDLDAELRGIDEAYSLNMNEDNIIVTVQSGIEPNDLYSIIPSYQREYNAQNAVMYALTYSTSGDDDTSIPSYRNECFKWNNNSCQLFVSQCIWAGFGGSNSQTDINNRLGMDTTGSYQWWSTGTSWTSSGSWSSCSAFRTYLNGVNVNLNEGESGIICDTHSVAKNDNNLVGSGLTQSDLIGAVLHVKGSGGEFSHAVILNNAAGTTRSTVYFTGYNNCWKNIQLSKRYPTSSTNESNKIFVIVPRVFNDANGAIENYLSARLENAMVKGTSGFTRTLYGYAYSSVPEIKMYVYAPGDSTASYTFRSTNRNIVSGDVFFNETGDWKVVVTGTGLASFTYMIRIV